MCIHTPRFLVRNGRPACRSCHDERSQPDGCRRARPVRRFLATPLRRRRWGRLARLRRVSRSLSRAARRSRGARRLQRSLSRAGPAEPWRPSSKGADMRSRSWLRVVCGRGHGLSTTPRATPVSRRLLKERGAERRRPSSKGCWGGSRSWCLMVVGRSWPGPLGGPWLWPGHFDDVSRDCVGAGCSRNGWRAPRVTSSCFPLLEQGWPREAAVPVVERCRYASAVAVTADGRPRSRSRLMVVCGRGHGLSTTPRATPSTEAAQGAGKTPRAAQPSGGSKRTADPARTRT